MPTTGSWTFQSRQLLWLWILPVTCWPMMIANHFTAPFAKASERWLQSGRFGVEWKQLANEFDLCNGNSLDYFGLLLLITGTQLEAINLVHVGGLYLGFPGETCLGSNHRHQLPRRATPSYGFAFLATCCHVPSRNFVFYSPFSGSKLFQFSSKKLKSSRPQNLSQHFKKQDVWRCHLHNAGSICISECIAMWTRKMGMHLCGSVSNLFLFKRAWGLITGISCPAGQHLPMVLPSLPHAVMSRPGISFFTPHFPARNFFNFPAKSWKVLARKI